jgi:CopG family nickel-responsive transcriptional regulator
MQRVTITIDDDLMAEIDRIIAVRGYQNRSEAFRDLSRAGITQTTEAFDKDAECIAALVYLYDHSVRQLSKRLTNSFHEHHDLSLGTLHMHLNAETCMEVTILRGRGSDVRHFAEHVIAERGVRHGRLVSVPFESTLPRQAHSHPHPAPADHGSHGRRKGRKQA